MMNDSMIPEKILNAIRNVDPSEFGVFNLELDYIEVVDRISDGLEVESDETQRN